VAWVARVLALGVVAVFVLAPSTSGLAAGPPPLPTLLARYAPVVVLHPAERFRPVPVDGFLADSDLELKTPTGWEKVDGPLPAGGSALRLDQRYCQAIGGVAASQCYADAQAAHAAASVVYGAASRTKTRIVLQYWLFYPYDDYSPTVPAGDIWQVHEGDWEAIAVILDRSGKPLLAGYSQHSAGRRRAWAKVPKLGARPLVYVALGSHANYFRAGESLLDPRVIDPALIAVVTAYGVKPVEHAGGGVKLRPRLVPVRAASPSWMAFAGTWGESGYVHFPDNAPVAAGTGPRGPAFHALWRTPVKTVLGWPKG
jgi:hypothetical protein